MSDPERWSKMKANHTTSLIGVFQAGVVVIGIFVVDSVLKIFSGLFAGNSYYESKRVFAVWIRDSGWMLLLVPLVWVLCVARFNSDSGKRKMIIARTGYALIALLIGIFLWGLGSAYYMPALIAL
jgi:hypothetical protein